MLTGNEIRTRFLQYFENHGHTVVPSSPLIPHQDPTLLFINAGMNQFKDVFLGREKRDYVRAASAQKCVRAGGKHNDLENVGQTARHHTFFEMLGNFSFGDYFKDQAIAFAWEFLTVEMGLPKEKLWVTVFREDDEAYNIWRDRIGVPENASCAWVKRITSGPWAIPAPAAPVPKFSSTRATACPAAPRADRRLRLRPFPGALEPGVHAVRSRRRRHPDPAAQAVHRHRHGPGAHHRRHAGGAEQLRLRPAARHHRPRGELSGKRYGDDAAHDMSMRVIADHSRATAFLIADGVLPSNEGRGYVLRRIMRRAARHAKMLGFAEPVLYRTATYVLQSMAEAYPEPAQRADYVAKIVKIEEERFIQTLDNGLRILTEEVERLKAAGASVLPGDIAFKLYDTFGFPLDLTADILRSETSPLTKTVSRPAWKNSARRPASTGKAPARRRWPPSTGNWSRRAVAPALPAMSN
jgi:alanyl-tRNA synthetase